MTLSGAHCEGAEVNVDAVRLQPLSRSDTEIRLEMPSRGNGYAIVSVRGVEGTAYARFLYTPPRLYDLPPGFITTVAGIGRFSGEFGPATEIFFRQPWAVAFDPLGRLHVSDTPNNRVFRLLENGIAEAFAGNGVSGGSRPTIPTPAAEVSIDFPRSIAFDSKGNLIVPDSGYYLWRVTPSGIAEIIAGNGKESPMAADGVLAKGSSAGFPTYVAVDSQDNILFIDWAHARVRKIDTAGVLSTVAGTGTYGFSGDGGSATSAQFRLSFNDRGGLALDAQDNIYLLDEGNHRIRRIVRTTGMIETIAGPTVGGQLLDNLRALCVEDGRLHFSNASQIFRREVDGTIVALTTGQRGFSDDGTRLSEAKLGAVEGLAIAPSKNLIYVDDVGRVREVDRTTQEISTIAGIGPRVFGEGGAATAAAFRTQNQDLDLLPTGELVIADTDRLAIFRPDGVLVRLAGSRLPITSLEGPALTTAIAPASVSSRPDGTLDLVQGSIGVFRIDPDGTVRRTTGGTGECLFSGDGGPALAARLCQPWDVLHDGNGGVIVADTNNNRVRRVNLATGIIETIAGSGPVNGLERYGFGSTCGDGGPATAACINTPYGLAIDPPGNLYVCENQSRIRRIDRSGIIGTLAVTGCTKLAWLFGNLYSLHGDRLSRITSDGVVTTVAGGDLGFSGDGGPAREARIHAQKQSHGIAADSEGNLFFCDGDNLRVRAVRFGAVLPPPGAQMSIGRDGSTLRVAVVDAVGRPSAGVRVELDAPLSGASCTLASPYAITDAAGFASVVCTPNCVAGTYSVTARMLIDSTATISFANAGRCRRRAVRH